MEFEFIGFISFNLVITSNINSFIHRQLPSTQSILVEHYSFTFNDWNSNGWFNLNETNVLQSIEITLTKSIQLI